MTPSGTPSPPDPITVLREVLNEGYHKGGHHPRCATGTDEGCNCYARSRKPARDALDAVVQLRDAAREWATTDLEEHMAAGRRLRAALALFPDPPAAQEGER